MVHEGGTLADEYVDLVAEAHRFVQRDAPQTHRARNTLVQYFGTCVKSSGPNLSCFLNTQSTLSWAVRETLQNKHFFFFFSGIFWHL